MKGLIRICSGWEGLSAEGALCDRRKETSFGRQPSHDEIVSVVKARVLRKLNGRSNQVVELTEAVFHLHIDGSVRK